MIWWAIARVALAEFFGEVARKLADKWMKAKKSVKRRCKR